MLFRKSARQKFAVDTVNEFLEAHPEIEKVYFVCFDRENFLLYESLLMW